MKKQIGLLVACLVMSINANAAVINFGPVSAGGSGPNISINNLVTPTATSGDATITLNLNGDFNSSSEYVDITIDGFSLGRIFDNNTANDAFDFAGDIGNQSQSTLTGTATISQSIFAGLIADGFLNLFFDTSSGVNCCGTVNHLSGTIAFNEVSAVPLPAALLMFGPALLGFMGFRRKFKA